MLCPTFRSSFVPLNLADITRNSDYSLLAMDRATAWASSITMFDTLVN
jgi:hypothetical protein